MSPSCSFAGSTWPSRGEKGFALAMVVFLLFAVSVAGAVGYQLVSTEADLAGGGNEGEAAIAVARAGLERYVGEHIGKPTPTTYAVDTTGTVTITPRLLAAMDGDTLTQMYLLEAVGLVPDRRRPNSPAKRTVREYAILHREPVGLVAALMSIETNVTVTTADTVSGVSTATSGAPIPYTRCDQGAADLYGVANPSPGTYSPTTGTAIAGNPSRHLTLTNSAAFYTQAAVRWSILKNPSFPIPFDGTWPNFASLAADSFPVVRVTGDLNAGTAQNGRGALIVTGTFTHSAGFTWDGIILAGRVTTLSRATGADANIQGMLIAGLDGSAAPASTLAVQRLNIRYNTCKVRAANHSLAYFELLDDTRWEF